MKLKTATSLIVLGLALAGCNRSINSLAPESSAPQRLPSAPVEPVQQSNLPPPSDQIAPVDAEANTPNAGEEAQNEVASLETPTVEPAAPAAPPASAEKISYAGVSGAYKIESDNPNCNVILAFSSLRSGGYRAATKRCNAAEITSIAAWDIKGQQIVLMDNNGNSIARVYNSGGSRFDGTTNSGKPITFTR